MILRQGKTPSGKEVRTILKHVVQRIRAHWPKVDIRVRGDSHYGRDEVMEWCENHGVDYVFGFGGNDVLQALTRAAADAVSVQRALSGKDKLRGSQPFRYVAKSWDTEPRSVARSGATPTGCDVRRHGGEFGIGWIVAPGLGARIGLDTIDKGHQLGRERHRFKDSRHAAPMPWVR